MEGSVTLPPRFRRHDNLSYPLPQLNQQFCGKMILVAMRDDQIVYAVRKI